MIAIEHDSLKEGRGLATDIEKVAAFLQLVAEDSLLVVVVLNSKFLRHRRRFMLKGAPYKLFRLNEVDQEEVLKACTSHGHCSILFLVGNPAIVASRFLEQGFYDGGKRISLATEESQYPLAASEAESLAAFLVSEEGKKAKGAFMFSHDAAQFYQVYPTETESRFWTAT